MTATITLFGSTLSTADVVDVTWFEVGIVGHELDFALFRA